MEYVYIIQNGGGYTIDQGPTLPNGAINAKPFNNSSGASRYFTAVTKNEHTGALNDLVNRMDAAELAYLAGLI